MLQASRACANPDIHYNIMVVQEDTLPSRVNAADGAETMSPQANDALDLICIKGLFGQNTSMIPPGN